MDVQLLDTQHHHTHSSCVTRLDSLKFERLVCATRFKTLYRFKIQRVSLKGDDNTAREKSMLRMGHADKKIVAGATRITKLREVAGLQHAVMNQPFQYRFSFSN